VYPGACSKPVAVKITNLTIVQLRLLVNSHYQLSYPGQGQIQGGAPGTCPPKIGGGEKLLAWNRDFSHKIPQNCSRLPLLGTIFLSVPPPNLKSWIRLCRASKRNFARWNKTDLGPRGQTETSLSKLKILVEITKKIKTNNMTKAMGAFGFGDVQPRTDVPTERPLIGPGHTAFYWGPSCQ
jgi:hypothetical protein